jgi:hypothetical protein
MKPNSVIIFLGTGYELCMAFGLFGKENLEYKSEFDHRVYKNSKYVKYYFEKLNCDIIFLSQSHFIDDLDISLYDNKIITVSESDIIDEKCDSYKQKYPNCKLVFLWMYGEVFYKTLLQKCKKANLDLLLSGSNQIGLDEIGIFDYKLNFKYFYYYIGYYYLKELMSNLKNKKYDINHSPIFTYSKSSIDSNWRSEILNDLHNKFPNKIYSGNSINDSYDLEYTKYKHFETINDYSYKNYNLIFETIDYRNSMEYFVTEKTFKGLFFNNPFYLVAPTDMLNELSKDFYLLNSEFENLDSFVGSEDLAEKFDYHMDKSKDNLSKLLEYINDYSHIEHFKKLLNI